MTETGLVCRICGIPATSPDPEAELFWCKKCGNDLKADPPMEESDYLKSSRLADRPAAQDAPEPEPDLPADECPRPECVGDLDGSTCMLCGLPAFIRYRLPWQGEVQLLRYGQKLSFGRVAGDFEQHLKDSPNVSAVHCEISLDGSYPMITDLESTNGTYLDGARLTPNVAHRLKAPAELRLGRDNHAKRLNAVIIQVVT